MRSSGASYGLSRNLGILAVRLGVLRMGVGGLGVLGVPIVLGVKRFTAVVGVTLFRLWLSPVRSGDLVFARRDCLVSGRADLALLADADRGLDWFGIFDSLV